MSLEHHWPYVHTVGDIIASKGSKLGIREIEDYELVYFPEGTGTVYEWGGVPHVLDSPCFVFTRPRESHQYLFDRERNTRHLFVHFDYEPLRRRDERFAAMLQQGFHIIPARHSSLVAAMMQQIIVVAGYQSHHWKQRLSSLVAAAMEELAAYADNTPEFASESYPVQVSRGITYIEEHLTEPITIEQVARHAGWSHEHFTRMFVAAVGMSPKRLLLERRLRLAEEFMLLGSQSVKQIAYQCGFGDEHHFSKIYKRIRGITATEYLERCKEPIFRHAAVEVDPGRTFANRHILVNAPIK
ncbi:AraC family transcriptional regulator [Paenibacillus sacheonensis]|uniref:Helix-turn-helix domain-containing protein n=1 Tax=Paenibacillus sacheonensis TaxID=742054 RepID=A0A7X4YJK3_9BACL|nr:helix-turn-helix domain-containing protein [Paenibacillus sacheonensis]MBM7564120.1 AraC-like DNA-binding protein [Paenibacillus sacheonensis]NBC67550.1 helix-turn-helix domain-containing protein [Paenibacillus sacheonensis]